MRASSTSSSRKSTIPWTSAWASRCSTGTARHDKSCSLRAAVALDGFRELHEPFRRVRPAIEDHVFDAFEQVGRNVFVDRELASVDDAHVEAGFDGVVQECRMNRFADDVVAAE